MSDFNPTSTPSADVPPVMARSLHWPWFTLALVLPPVLTFATAMAGWKDFPVACPFVGGGIAGLVCGILLGRYLGKTPSAAAGFCVLFVLLFGALSFALCFGGCLVGNYNF